MANFVVQKKSPQELTQEDTDALAKWTSDEGWDPYARPNDISHMYSGPPYVDSTKAFFGFLDGKRIGHIAMSTFVGKDGDLVQYIGKFIVEKSLRGKGYGLKIWKAMWECIDPNANTCLDSVIPLMPQYESWGLKFVGWHNWEYIIPLSAIAEKYKVTESIGNISTKLLSESNFDKYDEYITNIYGGLCRTAFIKRWSTLPESCTWVALNENSDIVGCITVRESPNKQDLIVGPMYSNNLDITKKLIYVASQAMTSQTTKNLRMLTCAPPGEANTVQMIKNDFGVECNFTFVRMCSKKPTVDASRVVAIHSAGYS